jgi:membrane-associated phospholipid phosphatase
VDAGIGCWKTKFRYNQERPVKYIREVLGHPSWSPLFDNPPFPDFPSGHSTIAGSFAEILKGFFGNSYHFTDHTYDYLGMSPRSYTSFDELAKEVSESRVYAGIHYRYSCDKGCEQGRKIGKNINRKLKFLK